MAGRWQIVAYCAFRELSRDQFAGTGAASGELGSSDTTEKQSELIVDYPPERLLAASAWAEQELCTWSSGSEAPVTVLAVGPPGVG